jgi:hypothetical protein
LAEQINVFSLVITQPAGDGTTAASGGKKTDDASSSKRIAQLVPVYELITGDPMLGEANGIALTSTIDDLGQAWLYNIV